MALRTAVIGHGNIGDWHAYLAHKIPSSHLVAICDTDDSRLDNVDDRLNVEKYKDMKQMLKREEIDSVHICTPPQTHLSIAEEVLSLGIPTLIEKPIASSLDHASKLMDLSEETGTTVSPVHHKLFEPVMQKARNLVESGVIGEVVGTFMLFGEDRNLDKTPRGEWVFDLPSGELGEGLPHQVYLPLAFAEGLGEIRSVSTQQIREYENPIDFDGVNIEATDASSEQLVAVKVGANSVEEEILRVYGTDGRVEIDFHAMTVVYKGRGRDINPIRYNIDTIKQQAATAMENKIKSLISPVSLKLGFGSFNSGHYQQIKQHNEALLQDREPPVTARDGYNTVRVIEALRDAEQK